MFQFSFSSVACWRLTVQGFAVASRRCVATNNGIPLLSTYHSNNVAFLTEPSMMPRGSLLLLLICCAFHRCGCSTPTTMPVVTTASTKRRVLVDALDHNVHVPVVDRFGTIHRVKTSIAVLESGRLTSALHACDHPAGTANDVPRPRHDLSNQSQQRNNAVSYTHLTLPTKRIV